ncbi:MAG TPA: hypothetical protein VGX76_22790 [Pirellulales bacterium]|jgi:hypothetical protein|nr:hypothetical protein [Pirellulales bacterium]
MSLNGAGSTLPKQLAGLGDTPVLKLGAGQVFLGCGQLVGHVLVAPEDAGSDGQAAIVIGVGELDRAIDAPRPQQGAIQPIDPISRDEHE